MSKPKVEVNELQIVPSAKDAVHIVASTEVDLDLMAGNLDEKLKLIYQNQINQLNQTVTEKADDENKEKPRKQK